MVADWINGSFEFAGSITAWLNVRQLLRDRQVAGVYGPAFYFFSIWGLWNLWYYPHLDQWMSFAGGLSITAGNLVWCALRLRYKWQGSK